MPYNTRRKSLSLPSLGIHIPTTHAARIAATATSKTPGRPSSSSSSSSSVSPAPSSSAAASRSPESQPTKRLKRSHSEASPSATADSSAIETTPPPSPSMGKTVEMADATEPPKVDLEGINDDIVEGVILQLQATANRPHLVKELETVLAQSLKSVQNSANPCAIISSRLSSYLKRSCWSALAPCPLAKELETVHPRRTYFFLTTFPRQPLPEPNTLLPSNRASIITPSVSLTDDSGSDDLESRRRELSPSPEIDLSPPEFEDVADDSSMPITPIGSLYKRHLREMRHNSPPLEKDEREFTQTADFLQKRKLSDDMSTQESADRNVAMEFGYREDVWFSENQGTTLFASPSIKPAVYSSRKDDDAENWLKLNALVELGRGAESIEIDELDCLLDAC